jgi:hemoglobin
VNDEPSVYEAAGGLPALERVARAWHERCLADPVLEHPFSHKPVHPQHSERLAAYWAEQLGGPPLWTGGAGDPGLGSHVAVVRMHSGDGVHDDMDRRAVDAFVGAMDDAGLPDEPRLRATLTAWFTWAVAVMAAYPRSPDDVPDVLAMPHWSWDGPVASP